MQQDQNEKVKGLIEAGHSAAWEQDWERAVSFYKKAIDLDPQSVGALISLGLAYLELDKHKEAFQAYSQAAKIQPDDPIPMEKMAHIAAELGHKQQALGLALKAGELYLKKRDVQKTIDNWAFAIHCDPEDLQAHTYLAKLYEKSGQREQAVRELMILAGIQQRNGEAQKAMKTLEHALEIYPQRREVEEAIRLLEQGQPLPKPSLEIPEFAVKPVEVEKPKAEKPAGLDPIAEAHQLALAQLASVFFDVEEEPTSETIEKKGLASWFGGGKNLFTKQSDFGKIFRHLGAYLEKIKQEENTGLIEELTGAIEAGFNHPAAQFELGYLLALGKDDRSIKYLQQAAKHEPYQIAAHLLMGHAYSQANRERDAVRAYLSALRYADVSSYKGGQAKELDQLYDPLIDAILDQKEEQNYQKVVDGVRELLLRKDWRAHLEKTRQQMPIEKVAGRLLPIGEVFSQAGGYKLIGALAEIQDLAQQGYYRSAMEEAYYALQHMPTYLPLHVYMGELLLRQGLTEEAFAKFLTAAISYETRGDYPQAIQLYRRLIEVSPMSPHPRHRLIQILKDSGDAQDCLQEYLQLAEVYYNLADLKKARATYQQALDFVRKHHLEKQWEVMILHLMADIDLQNLDWRQALELYEQIRRIDPKDEKARYQLIDLNLRTQQEPQAIVELDSYLDLLKKQGKLTHAREFLQRLETDYGDWQVIKRRLDSLGMGRHTR